MEKLKRVYEIPNNSIGIIEEIHSALGLCNGSFLNSKETEYRISGTNYTLKESDNNWVLFDSGNFVKMFDTDKDAFDYLKDYHVNVGQLIPERSEIINQESYFVGASTVQFVKRVVNEKGELQTDIKVICISEKKEEMDQIDCIMRNLLYEEQIKPFFIGSSSLFEQLKALDKKKQELRRLVNESEGLIKPVVITVSGTPRAGKTTCIDNLFEFFKKADLRTVELEEPAGLVYQTLKNKEEKKELLKDRVGFVDRQYEIGSTSIQKNLKDADIILCDRGILDTFIWYNMYYQDGMMSAKRYQEFLKRLRKTQDYFNCFYALYAEPLVSMQRDYINSLSLEPRSTMNIENVEKYNAALRRLEGDFIPNVDVFQHLDTTKLERMDASVQIVDNAMDYVMQLCRRK